MKKAVIIPLFLVLLISNQSFGQEQGLSNSLSSKISYGVTAGLNVANCYYDEFDEDDQYVKGIRFGFVADYPLNKKYSIRTGLAYSAKGTKWEFGGTAIWYQDTISSYKKGEVRLNYLEIPIEAVYSLNNFEIGLGGYIALGVSGKINAVTIEALNSNIQRWDYNHKINFVTKVKDDDIQPERQIFDTGLNLHAAYNYKNILASISFTRGLSTIYAPKIDSKYDPSKEFNFVFIFSISYWLNKGGIRSS